MGDPPKDTSLRPDQFQPQTVAEIFQQEKILRDVEQAPPAEIGLFMGVLLEEVVRAGLKSQPNHQGDKDYQLLPSHLAILLRQKADLADHMPVTPELVERAKGKVRRLLALGDETAIRTKQRLEQAGKLLMNHILAREEQKLI